MRSIELVDVLDKKKERIEKLSHLLVRGYSSRSQLFMVRFLFSPYEDHRSRCTDHSHGSQSCSDPGDAEDLHPWHHALDVQYMNGEARHVDQELGSLAAVQHCV